MAKREEASGLNWSIRVTRLALEMLEGIGDLRTRGALVKAIDGLANDPHTQGKPLVGSLAGYRSVRAAGQRYRIIFRVEQEKVVVYVVALGIRKDGESADIYELARKLMETFKKRKGK